MPLCSLCHTIKPPAEFYPDRTRSTGVQSACKACKRAEGESWREAHRASERARAQAWREANRERVLETNREYDRTRRKRKETGR